MTYPRRLLNKPEFDQMDRQLIRVELPTAQAAIAASLRRAFRATPIDADDNASDFAALLSRLN